MANAVNNGSTTLGQFSEWIFIWKENFQRKKEKHNTTQSYPFAFL